MPRQKVLNWGPAQNEIMKMKLKLIVMNIWSSAVKKIIFKWREFSSYLATRKVYEMLVYKIQTLRVNNSKILKIKNFSGYCLYIFRKFLNLR